MAGLDFYKQSEGIDATNPGDIVLPRIVDGGQALAGVSESLMAAAKPYLVKNAEEAAATQAGITAIVRDPVTGNYTRGESPKGGIIYTQALNAALDMRESTLRNEDYENRIHALALEHDKDPAGFNAAASSMTEAMLSQVPPQLRPKLEGAWARTFGEYTRGLGDKVKRETEHSLMNAAQITVENGFKKISAIVSQNPGGDNDPLVAPIVDEIVTATRSMRGLGMTQEEVDARASGVSVSLMDEAFVTKTAKALAASGPLFATADSPEKLTILETWGKGIKTDDKIAGLTFDSFQQTYGPQIGARIGNYAEEKRHAIEAEQARQLASQPKPMTASEILSDLQFQNGGNPGGVPMSRDQYAALNIDFLRRMGGQSVTDIMMQPEGRVAVAGMVAQTGAVPVGTTEAITKLRANGGASQAFQAIAVIRQQTHDKYQAGETYFRNLPTELKSLYSWVEELHQLGIQDKDIDAMDRAKATGQWKGLDKGAFASYQTPQKKAGYNAIRDQAVSDLFGIKDPHALDNSRPIWEHEYDMLMEANLNRFDNPQQAFQATAKTMRSLLTASPYFWGGIGDSRIFHAGMAPKILDSMAANDPRFKGVKWTDVQPNGQPAVILKNVQSVTYPNKIGQYEVRVFIPRGQANGGQQASVFRVDMDQLLAEHDKRYGAYKRAHAEELRKDARPDPWIIKDGKYILNPALGEWQQRQAAKTPKGFDRSRFNQQIESAGYVRR